ncbi:MAG: SPOR domain-containing protein, partial [Gammaproteobacteria bacterium]|nr:SPOR domain-containing protein [Gammaproteobacteria bacterium]
KYAINLESSQKKAAISINLKDFNVSDKYKVYQTEISLGRNKSFYRLRIGFFKSKKEAARIAQKFKSKYSKLWVDRLHKQDREILVAWLS